MKKLLFLSYFLLVTVVTINAQCWQTLASGSLHSLAIKGDGTLWAWGFNSYGELGDNTTTNKSTPVQIGSATNWKTVSIGQYHSMGIKTDGTLWAWGSNSNGQLGDGTTVSKLVPVQIGTDNNWFYISLNSNHSIAIKTDGTMWGCGLNSTSQLGDGTSIDKNAFIQIGTATNWISASSGYDFTMAIQTNGTLWGFGSNNFSKLGDGTTTLRSTPVQIGTATNWSVAASGQIHSIALKTDGTLWSWGYSSNTGNLGLGAVTTQPNPAQIGTATNWKAVAAGYRHSLATKTDGTLWAFGYNNNGQLGDGTTTDRNIPTQVGTGTNWLYPKAGSFFSSGIQSNNTIWCSGASSSGQLGDGTTVGKTSFVQALTACTAGAALNFDGANDKVALGAFSINGAASRTVEFWIKTSITGGFQNPFSSGTANNSQAFNIKVTPTGHLGFMGFNNDNYPSTGTVIADNTYHHVALTYNGANVKAYIDGNLEWTFVTTLATTGTNNYIGASNHAGNEQYFLGTIDELRVWNVARTQCEINIYKNCEIPATSVGLLANYHFNQGLDASPNPTETLLTDGAGSAYSGTLTTFALTGTTSNWVAPGGVVSGYTTTTITTPTVTVNSGSVTSGASFTMTPAGGVSYTYLPSGPIVTPSTSSTYTVTGTTAPGCTNTAISTVSVQGAALNFDGSNDFVSIGSVIPLNSSYTKEAWIYANASGSNNIISSGSAAFWLAGGKLSAFNNGGATISDPAAFPLNQWVHVAVSLNAANGVLSLFKNGVLVASGSSNTGYAADAIAIGQYGPSAANFFQGAMDEVRIWNRALCSSEIQNNMNAELPSGQTGLLSYYKMNQGFASLANPTATVLIDASGASNNAPLSNFAYAGNTSNWIAPGGVITGSTAVFFNSPISASAATTSVSCGGSATGSATITAAGGAPYTYSWSPSVGTTSVVSSLSASNYTVLVTGVCGVKIVTLSIAGPSAITTATAVTNLACNGGSNGAASINASGGTGGYTYLWSNGGTTSAITGLMAGVYTATVTDANSCTSIKSASVTQPSALVTSTAVTNVACNGGSNGVTSITASGGAGGYTYLWSNGGTTSAITGLMAGVYTATVTDANSCTSIKSATVAQPSALSANASASAILCNGGMSTVTVTATGGTTAYTGVGTFTALAGTQTYTVTDANGCSTTTSFSITEPTILSANASASSILCNGGMSTVTVSATGGTAAYIGVGTFTALAGTQTYTVTDANGCSTTNSVSITQPSAIVSSQSFTLCNGQSVIVATSTYSTAGTFTDVISSQLNGCDSTITTNIMINALPNLTVTSGAICAGESFTMSPSGAVTYTYSNGSNIITPASTDTYTVTGTDANGCVNSAISSVTVNTLPTISVISSSVCAGATGTVIASGADTYTWSTGSNAASVSDSPLTTTVYTVNGTSLEGCLGSETTATITVGAAPSIVVNSESVCAGSSATLTANGVTTYTWSTGENTSTIIVTPTTNTVYTVNGDLVGCAVSATSSSTITINALPTISVNSGTICAGQSFTMVPNGAVTYTYSNGTDVVTPTTDATYSVSGTDVNGCVSSVDAISSVTVNALPVLIASTTNTLMCTGETATLSVTGASSYTWSTTETTVDIVIAPTVQTTYTVDGTDANGCSNSTTITQDVSLCTGIAQVSNLSSLGLNVYPNPTNAIVTVQLENWNSEGTTITITNAIGQVVLIEITDSQSVSFNLSQVSAGVYTVKAQSKGITKTVRLIKQ